MLCARACGCLIFFKVGVTLFLGPRTQALSFRCRFTTRFSQTKVCRSDLKGGGLNRKNTSFSKKKRYEKVTLLEQIIPSRWAFLLNNQVRLAPMVSQQKTTWSQFCFQTCVSYWLQQTKPSEWCAKCNIEPPINQSRKYGGNHFLQLWSVVVIAVLLNYDMSCWWFKPSFDDPRLWGENSVFMLTNQWHGVDRHMDCFQRNWCSSPIGLRVKHSCA